MLTYTLQGAVVKPITGADRATDGPGSNVNTSYIEVELTQMSGALNEFIKPDDMLLSIVSWWICAANGPHAVESDVLRG